MQMTFKMRSCDGIGVTPRGGNRRSILLRPRRPFPPPPGRSDPRRRRGRHGVRRCPNRHRRWLAEEPPLPSCPLPGLGLSRPGERAGSVEMVQVPLRRQPVRPSHTLGRLRFSVDEPHSLSVPPLCQAFFVPVEKNRFPRARIRGKNGNRFVFHRLSYCIY